MEVDGHDLQASISGYYYTHMRDLYVGILSGVALFLISYRGYEEVDNIVVNMSGVFALGIVMFPTAVYTGKVQNYRQLYATVGYRFDNRRARRE